MKNGGITAHLDKRYYYNKNLLPLEAVTLLKIKNALEAIKKVISVTASECLKTYISCKVVTQLGSADALIQALINGKLSDQS